MTAPLVSEDRIAELAVEACNGQGMHSSRGQYIVDDAIWNAIYTAVREAGEESAKICDAEASQLGQTHEALVAGICAAEIRRRLG